MTGTAGPTGADFSLIFLSSGGEYTPASEMWHTELIVTCPTGSIAIGGGSTRIPDAYGVEESGPLDPTEVRPRTWRIEYVNDSRPLQAGVHFAICLQLPV